MGDVRIGEVIRGYRLDALIARGGMGAVYAATHESLGRRAAVKVLAPQLVDDRDYVSRFLSEARIVNSVRHPNIIDVFDFVDIEKPRRVAFVMELLAGPALSDVLKKGPLRPVQAFNAIIQLADALEAVHEKGVVHRDLKPHNVMVVAALSSDLSSVPSMKLLDFGIAKVSGDGDGVKTMTGQMMGTPAYIAPEQISESAVSAATDLYALAEILFEMLSGKRLFSGDNLQIMGSKVRRDHPELKIAPKVPGADQLTSLLRACIAPEPEDRPSLHDFRLAVRGIAEAEGLVTSTSITSGDDDDDDDGGKTMLDASVPEDDGATTTAEQSFVPPTDLDPPESTTGSMMGMTNMFLSAIKQGFDEPKAAAPVPTPVQTPAPKEEKLELGIPSKRERAQSFSRPPSNPSDPRPALARDPVRPRGASFSQPVAIVQGTPVHKQRKKPLPGLLGLAALLSLAAGALVYSVKARAPNDVDDAAPLISARQRAWAARHGEVKESFEELFGNARTLHALDQAGSYAAADEALQKALLLRPDEPRAIALWAENLLLWRGVALPQQERDELEAFLSVAAKRAPKDGEVLRARAVLARLAGRLPEANQLIAAASEAAPDEARTRVGKAEIEQQADPVRSLALLDDALAKIVPRSRRVEAVALSRSGHPNAALAALKKHPASGEPDAGLLFLEATVLEQSGEVERALKLATLARKAPGETCQPRLLLAKLSAQRAQLADAATELRSVTEDTSCASTLRAQAGAEWSRLDISRRDTSAAETHAKGALAESAGRQALASLTAIEVALVRGDLPQAKQIFDAAPVDTRSRPDVAIAGAAASAGQDDFMSAKAALDAARSLAPGDYTLRVSNAAIEWLAGRGANLGGELAALAEMDPLEGPARDGAIDPPRASLAQLATRLTASGNADLLIGAVHFCAGELDEADKALASAAKAPTADTLVALLRGYVALARNRPADAEAQAKRALSKNAASIGSKHLLARAQAATGKSAAAEKTYAEVLAAAPTRPLAAVEALRLTWKQSPKTALPRIEKLCLEHGQLAPARRLAFDAGL